MKDAVNVNNMKTVELSITDNEERTKRLAKLRFQFPSFSEAALERCLSTKALQVATDSLNPKAQIEAKQ
jgi:hypothetical protein